MKLHESPLLSVDLIALNSVEGTHELQAGEEVQFFWDMDQWFVRQGDIVKPVLVSQESVMFEGLAGRHETIWLLRKKSAKQLWVQFLSPIERLALDIEIGVDSLVVEDLSRHSEIPQADMILACDWLAKEFFIDGPVVKLVITRFTNSGDGEFQILGRRWRADVLRNKDGSYCLRRVARRTLRPDRTDVLEGGCRFVDVSVASQMQDPTQRAMLDATLDNNTTYLELWKLYNDLSWRRAQGAASKLGALPYISCEGFELSGGNAWRLKPKNQEAFQAFKELWQQLGLSESDQVELSEVEPDWSSELVDALAQERTVRGRLIFEARALVIQPDQRRKSNTPPRSGYLYYSLAGERTAGKRREEAKRSIDSGQRLPQLRYLLEGVSVPIERRRRLADITPYAKESFKGGMPTDRQRLALSKALNTPDIALIIGPPGTGKTQVIAALQRRLAEESKGQNLRGQVLISSYQHDAVDNALSRSDVFGLPPVRVGGRRSDEQSNARFEAWSQKLTEHLEARVQALEEAEPLLKHMRALRRQFQLLRMAGLDHHGRVNALEKADDLLNQVQTHGVRIPSSLETEWKDYLDGQQLQVLKGTSDRDLAVLLRQVRSLRVESLGFADDGPDRADDLLRSLRRERIQLDAPKRELLEFAADAFQLLEPELVQLRQLRDHLLDRLIPDYRPPEVRTRLDSRGLKLLGDLEGALEQAISVSSKGIAGVLSQLSSALTFDPQHTQSTTAEYAMVVGATCQQSAGTQMSNLKSIAGFESTSISFDTVVIDEAARANPLDLFVPMAMAERRIVLVGDDRQLPHLLEPDIEQDVADEHNLTAVQRKAFETSLFERLRVQLQRLERTDGVQRVVMLDTQFRMHPVLGEFVSKNFYEPFGMESVKPGRKPEHFLHQLPSYEGKVCAWLDVPAALGGERKQGSSRIREAEVDAVVKEVYKLLQAGGEEVSIGVITFYSAQSVRIMEALVQLGVMIKTSEGFQLEPEYRLTSSGEERLRVGTVDAFQGKEFDVVFLSNVRSSTRIISANTESPEQREKQLNSKYGFLRLANRMNVAMSRQRKLLVVAGDRAMAEGEEAQEAVPALVNFVELCRGAYGCIR